MNKRTIIFFICTLVSMLVVNYMFDIPQQKRSEEFKEDKKLDQEAAKTLWEQQSRTKTASLKELAIESLYFDSEAKEFAAFALSIDELFIAFPYGKNVHKHLYRSSGSSLYLLNNNALSKEPLLYGTQENGALLTLPYFSQTDYKEVQLLSLKDTQSKPHIYFATAENGYVNIPYGAPDNNCLVLVNENKTFSPVAVFEASTKKLTLLQEIPSLAPFINVKKPAPTKGGQAEAFYVLENEFAQFVFSTKGAALAEINLPLKGKNNQYSLINPTRFDQILVKDYPKADHFPMHSYYAFVSGKQELIKEGALGGYYPLLRRALSVADRTNSRYYGLNLISNEIDIENLNYKVVGFNEKSIEFEASFGSMKIRKLFTVSEAPYCLDLSINLLGGSNRLWLTTGIPEVEFASGSTSSPVLKYRLTRGKKASVEKLKLPSPSLTSLTLSPDWVCNSNGFLGMILDPLTTIPAGYSAEKIEGDLLPTRLSLIDTQYNRYPEGDYPGYEILLPVKESGRSDFRLFSGPFATSLLKKIDRIYADPSIGYQPDYLGAQSFHGFFAFISEPFAKLLLFFMQIFYMITHSWGLSIILLTVFLKVLLYPLNAWSIKSTLRMQELAPKMKALQAKYKKEPQKLQMETWALYKKEKVNPFSGCLPMLIQIPFLLVMFDLLKSTFELRGASFIPGWINDLTAPDVLFSWSYPIPLIGTGFHLLPILLAALTFLQQKMSTKLPKDPALWTDQDKQQRMLFL